MHGHISGVLIRVCFLYRNLNCVHVRSLTFLLPQEEIDSIPEDAEAVEPSVDVLSLKPFLAGVFDGMNYGVIKRSSTSEVPRYNCSSC